MLEDYQPDDDLTAINHPGVNGAPDADIAPNAPTWTHQEPVKVVPPSYFQTQTPRTLPPPPPSLSRESAARERARKRRVRGRKKGGEWAWVLLAGAVFVIVIVMTLSVFILVRASQAEIEVIPTAAVALPTPVDARTSFDPSGLGLGTDLLLPDGTSIEIRPWDGQSRFTVVIMGLDRRLGETGLAYRTDTIMLASIDPQTGSVGLLSIPRDLYVNVPGYAELQRINSPMVFGETNQPGSGPLLMMQTVQNNFGIRVHDYFIVDFQVFVDVVDLLGGIDIDVEYTINDPQYPDMNYGYDPFFLRAGFHHLDGLTALKYARTRHGDNDFERAKRQQNTINAIRERALSLEMLPSLVFQAPSLWATWSDNVYTGLNLGQLVQLGLYLKDVPPENITMGVIDGRYIRPYSTSSGASVLIPNRASIGELMIEIFGPTYNQ